MEGRGDFLEPPNDSEVDSIHKHEKTGRPLGSSAFVENLENQLSRILKRRKPGPKQKKDVDN